MKWLQLCSSLNILWHCLSLGLEWKWTFSSPVAGCESWTIKKAERWRIDAFEMWCWRRLLRVPWTTRRSNQSVLKEINSEYSLEGLMLKMKLQYFGHLMQRTDSLEKTLILGNDWRQEEKGTAQDEMGVWHHQLNGHEFESTLGVGDGQGGLACYNPWVAKSWTWLSNWTELNWVTIYLWATREASYLIYTIVFLYILLDFIVMD